MSICSKQYISKQRRVRWAASRKTLSFGLTREDMQVKNRQRMRITGATG